MSSDSDSELTGMMDAFLMGMGASRGGRPGPLSSTESKLAIDIESSVDDLTVCKALLLLNDCWRCG